MIIEQYRCIADEAYLAFKEKLHEAVYNASQDGDVTDIDMELFRMHIVDLQEDLDDIIAGKC